MLVPAIRRFFDQHALVPRRVLLAVSGGFDSTALLLAFAELRESFEIVAAHVNHHLRGDESDGDEAFVRELCERLGVPLHIADGTLDPTAIRGRGIEAAAREVRFARLQEIRREVDADVIATAHQRDDQAETVLMRLMTGGGPAALRGIHPIRGDGVIRPLLDVPRREIVAFLEAQGIRPRTDHSNNDPRFLRNRIRKLLLDAPPAASANLARTATLARQQWEVLDQAIDAAEDVVMTEDATRFRSMPEDPWLRQALLHRHIVRLDPTRARDVGAEKLERLARGTQSRESITKSLELLRARDGWTLRRYTRVEPQLRR
jgi:tRNA(Ile)-lysidine synthase